MQKTVQVVIEISEKEYIRICDEPCTELGLAVRNGTPLPEGHGKEEEAIEEIKLAKRLVKENSKCDKAFDMAISALKLMPLIDKFKELEDADKVARLLAMALEPCETSTDEPMTMVYPTIFCDDAISRESIHRKLASIMNDHPLEGYEDEQLLLLAVEDEPSVQPRSKGHWIQIDYQRGKFECSECHTQGYVDTCMYKPIWEYCPRCGAKMGEKNENE